MGNFFTDVLQKRPEFTSTARQNSLDLLEPVFRSRVEAILAEAKAAGAPLMVFETFRSNARQLELFNKGVTKLKTVGVHLYGLACDIVKVVNGQPSWDGSFNTLCNLAHGHGLISGLDWGAPGVKHSFIDSDHVQRIAIHDQPALFAGTWYPDENYDPYKLIA